VTRPVHRTGPPGLDGTGVLVVVPTYDERDNLAELVARLRHVLPRVKILVVDDGSPDGTGALADELARADARVRVLHHSPRAGLGRAYVDAFSWLLAGGAGDDVGWIVQMDADGSHAPEELPRLLAVAGEADVVLGSRYVPGGDTPSWARHRRALSMAGNSYSRRALRLPLQDVTGGFRCFRRSVLAELEMGTVASEGYCFQVDVAFRSVRAGFRVREVPINFVERERGTSKMSGAVVREALWRVTSWGVRDRVRRLRARPTR
jgi:dolichol-phosphate mannosyltransferase